MHFLRCLLVVTLALSVCVGAACAADSRQPKTIKLLTVGNSFSGNACRYLTQITEAAGHKIIIGHADLGGCEMHRHWANIEASEKDPKGAAGRLYTMKVDGKDKRCTVKDIIISDKWDYVTIQQASPISSDITTYRPFAKNLRDYIRKNAPQAEILMHETWPYRVDDPRFDDPSRDSQKKMYTDLRSAYQTIAKELGLRIIPVGDAMYAGDTDSDWCYKPVKFDKAALKYPDLPDQTHSLNVGWKWQKDKNKDQYNLSMDGHHASELGCYLAGCVWFEFLFNESVENNKYVPSSIRAADARYLRALAHKIVGAK